MKDNRYRMPAEWETHAGTWIAWPHNVDHWPGNFEPVPIVYAEMIRALAGSERVFICVNDDAMEAGAKTVLQDAGLTPELVARIEFYVIPTDASWSRDHGPIFVYDNDRLLITDWIFNAWGQKYEPWSRDDVVPQRISELFDIPIVQPDVVLEGGSIDVNGKGSLLTTEQCLLNPNRNPQLNRDKIEDYLHNYLGASNVLWLKEGIIGDDTDGHIDDIARFVDETTVLCAVETNDADDNYGILQKNYGDLQTMRDERGRPLTVVEIPMPAPVTYQGIRLPASYINFYIANHAVLVPTFRCKQDQRALAIFSELFPKREIVGIDCVDLVWGLGTIHCSTQQQPAG